MVRVHIEGSIFATCSNDHTIRVWLTNSKDCKVSKKEETKNLYNKGMINYISMDSVAFFNTFVGCIPFKS